jgi:hypothetical protein
VHTITFDNLKPIWTLPDGLRQAIPVSAEFGLSDCRCASAIHRSTLRLIFSARWQLVVAVYLSVIFG